ncbi:MAG: NAD+ synthase [Alphaproteobacteria bacterium]|nr:MAG: NAD+ synthase [Alphaproteobacteria bacterium]
MTGHLAIALAQVNPTVGAIDANAGLVRRARAEAARMAADLVVFPELVITGYPPEDLVLRPAFVAAARAAVEALARETGDGGPALLVSSCWEMDGALRNAALLLDDGGIRAVRAKHALPNYGVFDEVRVFVPGRLAGPVDFRGIRLGVMTCEDMWSAQVGECLGETGAEMLVVLNASPYETGKTDRRLAHAVARVVENGLPLLFVNMVGGQDELVFDGASFVLDANRRIACQLPAWQEDIRLTRWRRTDAGWSCAPGPVAAYPGDLESIYQAMITGLRDYVRKNRFPGVLLGLSGGIDSALTAAVAVDALGPAAVECVMMPSRYTSAESLEDATACARNLGVRLSRIGIEPGFAALQAMLADRFAGAPADITEENLQSRLRGVVLMALSNKFGAMLLTTGNKSEMSVGYATLYGDMCGGYSVLKDIYKTTVFRLSAWRNAHRPSGALGPEGLVVPERIIQKPPSAELRPDQKDEDSLPPYARLDAILHGLIEEELSAAEIIARGHEAGEVARVEQLLYAAEYKRRQAPPGVKISPMNFGRDRRYPLTNAFRSPRAGGA